VVEWQGSVFVAGSFSSWNGQSKVQNLARLNNDGSLHTQWQFQSDAEIRTLVPTPTGLYLAGRFRKLRGQSFPGLARLQPNGSVDFGFRPNLSLKPGEFVRALSFSEREVFVLLSNNQIKRLDFAGRALPFQSPPSDGEFLSMEYWAPTQQLLVAGSFSQVQNQDRSSFAALNPKSGELLSSPEPGSLETKASQ
jgi:hypothetical protein